MNDTSRIACHSKIIEVHLDHMAWLTNELGINIASNTETISDSRDTNKHVVVTHHLPAKLGTMSTGYYTDILSPECTFVHKPVVWCCGHVHVPLNELVGDVLVVSAPMGYVTERELFTVPVYFNV